MSKDDDGTDDVGEFVENSGLVAGMVTGWALLVTFIDAESGETHYYGDSMEGQSAMTTLGLGQTMVAIESERIVRHHFEDES